VSDANGALGLLVKPVLLNLATLPDQWRLVNQKRPIWRSCLNVCGLKLKSVEDPGRTRPSLKKSSLDTSSA
jgi:hypothetical protein